jgi:transposase InsO family protein
MVPILYVIGPHAGSRAPNHPHHMVLCHVGHGPLGTLQKMHGDFTHLLVVVDKFSKWIKANPMDTIGSKQAVSFVQDIVFHFAVPNSIITDNDTQFTGEKFLNFCEDNNIRVDWVAVAQPRTNGQVERANGMILQGLKSRILTQEDRDIFA